MAKSFRPSWLETVAPFSQLVEPEFVGTVFVEHVADQIEWDRRHLAIMIACDALLPVRRLRDT